MYKESLLFFSLQFYIIFLYSLVGDTLHRYFLPFVFIATNDKNQNDKEGAILNYLIQTQSQSIRTNVIINRGIWSDTYFFYQRLHYKKRIPDGP